MTRMIANSYAKALYELQIPKDDINASERILDENPPLCAVLENPVISMEEKERVIDEIFPQSARSFIKVVCRHQSAGYFGEIFKAYKEYYSRKEGVLRAQLRYVSMPDSKQLKGMEEFLRKKHGAQEVEIELLEDKSLIGGFVLTSRGREYDRSIRGRLNDLKRQLNRR